jgi:hypothetical protein
MPKIKSQIFNVAGELQSTTEANMLMDEIKHERGMYLFVTDELLISDRFEKLTSTQQSELKTIRQAWRDMPQNFTEENAVFPTVPQWLKDKFPNQFEEF